MTDTQSLSKVAPTQSVLEVAPSALSPLCLYSPDCVEGCGLLKNSPGTYFQPRSGTKYADFGAS